jgi:seryl-tRNA synthetase
VQYIKQEIAKLESELTLVNAELNTILYSIPNVPHKSVPIGKDETQNKEIRK